MEKCLLVCLREKLEILHRVKQIDIVWNRGAGKGGLVLNDVGGDLSPGFQFISKPGRLPRRALAEDGKMRSFQ